MNPIPLFLLSILFLSSILTNSFGQERPKDIPNFYLKKSSEETWVEYVERMNLTGFVTGKEKQLWDSGEELNISKTLKCNVFSQQIRARRFNKKQDVFCWVPVESEKELSLRMVSRMYMETVTNAGFSHYLERSKYFSAPSGNGTAN